MKTVILTAVWRRPEIFRLFAKNILLNEINVPVVVVGSEGFASEKMIKEAGGQFIYVEHPNKPLAEKWNRGMTACAQLGATHVLCLGSDDLINKATFQEYLRLAECGFDYIHVRDWYFIDLMNTTMLYWRGYKPEHKLYRGGCGAGRMLSAEILNQLNWRMWTKEYDGMLDTGFDIIINGCSYDEAFFSLKNRGLFGLDIKTTSNMTTFDMWENTTFVNPEIILQKHLPMELAEEILHYGKNIHNGTS